MPSISQKMFLPAVLIGLLALPACSDDNVLAPQFEPEITNNTDSFAFQATDLADITQSLSYSWQNTGVSANLDQSSVLSEGTAVIVVKDAQDVTVHSGNLTDDGTFQTSEGTAGNWKVEITLTGTSGTLNFSLQKRT